MEVYFARCGDHVKIGTSKDVNARIKQLQTGARHKIRLLGTISGDFATERYIHGYLSNFRDRGEWFFFKDKFIKTYVGICIAEGSTQRAEEVAESMHQDHIIYDDSNVPTPYQEKQIKYIKRKDIAYTSFLEAHYWMVDFSQSYFMQSLTRRDAQRQLRKFGASVRQAKRLMSDSHKKLGCVRLQEVLRLEHLP